MEQAWDSKKVVVYWGDGLPDVRQLKDKAGNMIFSSSKQVNEWKSSAQSRIYDSGRPSTPISEQHSNWKNYIGILVLIQNSNAEGDGLDFHSLAFGVQKGSELHVIKLAIGACVINRGNPSLPGALWGECSFSRYLEGNYWRFRKGGKQVTNVGQEVGSPNPFVALACMELVKRSGADTVFQAKSLPCAIFYTKEAYCHKSHPATALIYRALRFEFVTGAGETHFVNHAPREAQAAFDAIVESGRRGEVSVCASEADSSEGEACGGSAGGRDGGATPTAAPTAAADLVATPTTSTANLAATPTSACDTPPLEKGLIIRHRDSRTKGTLISQPPKDLGGGKNKWLVNWWQSAEGGKYIKSIENMSTLKYSVSSVSSGDDDDQMDAPAAPTSPDGAGRERHQANPPTPPTVQASAQETGSGSSRDRNGGKGGKAGRSGKGKSPPSGSNRVRIGS